MTTRGFTYWVSDEQLRTYAARSVDQKLHWLDEMQRLTWSVASDDVKARWRRARAAAGTIHVHVAGWKPGVVEKRVSVARAIDDVAGVGSAAAKQALDELAARGEVTIDVRDHAVAQALVAALDGLGARCAIID